MRASSPIALMREVARDFGVALLIAVAVLVLACSDPRSAHSAPAAQPLNAEAIAAPDQISGGTLVLRHHESGAALPVVSLGTDVNVTVSGPVARAVVRQQFRNAGNTWANGVYAFPLPEGAAVDALRVELDNRVIEGHVATGEEARALYDRAKAQGADTSLIDQPHPAVFTAPVADIAPGETVGVRIEYQSPVQRDGSSFSLQVPLVAGTQAASSKANSVSLRVSLDPGFALGDITSLHHPVAIKREGDGSATLTLTGAAANGQPFELRWRPNAQPAPQVAVFHEPGEEIDYALAVVTPPAADRIASAPARDVIFVVDTSSSMHGEALDQIKHSLASALDRLHPGDRFNVIRFGIEIQAAFKARVEATPENLAKAHDFVDSLSASGGTDLGRALEAGLADPTPDATRLRQVVLITDGAVAEEAAAFTTIASHRGRSRLFLVGIGSAPNAYFMRRAAEVGRGAFTHIAAPDQVQESMQALFRKLERPAVTDLRAEWTPGVRVEAWPDPLPDLYADEPVVIAAQMSSLKGDLTLSGTLAGKPWKTVVKLAETPVGAGIAKLWAQRKIVALEARHWSGQDHAAIAGAIRAVAVAHRLVSAETSLIVTETRVSPSDGTPVHGLDMPLTLPAGWDNNAAFRAAPRANKTVAMARPLTLSEALSPEPAPAPEKMRASAEPPASQAGADPVTAPVSYSSVLSRRLVVVAVMAMFFAAMVAVTLGFWRHLSREYVSTRRPGRGT